MTTCPTPSTLEIWPVTGGPVPPPLFRASLAVCAGKGAMPRWIARPTIRPPSIDWGTDPRFLGLRVSFRNTASFFPDAL